MKCHYEVLGLESNCTSDDLKKAYRKLALEWHPDKNLHRLEEAKENFLLIQQAYEILTDPQERAWYDRHKDDILRGGAEQAYKDDCLDVYQYFNTSCFKGYNDDVKGFYTVYRQVFEKITTEDKPFMDDDDMEIPQFGYSYSSYEEVVHNFYAYWQSYCTAKSFSWVDKFDLTEARRSGVGRQMLRAMEKENKKLRDQHKKMRNEEVRELVAFVRKRDKRIQAHKKRMEEMKAEKAKKAEELRKKQVQERNKALVEDYTESAWSSMSQFENHFNEIESTLDATFGNNTDDINENDDELDELYCVACEKDFRSQKAFKNHENSKRHKENLAVLKELMEEEEAMATSETVEESSVNEDDVSLDCDQEESISSEALLDELIKSSTKSKKKKKKNKNSVASSYMVLRSPEEYMTEDNEIADVELKMDDIHIVEEKDFVEIQNNVDSTVKQNEASSNVEEQHEICSETEQTNDCLYTQQQKDCSKAEEQVDGSNSKEFNDNRSKVAAKSEPTKKKGKKDKNSKSERNTHETNEDSTEKPTTLCSTCNNNFSSRNKLFEHLKQTGHAAYKDESGTSSGSGRKQRKKKL